MESDMAATAQARRLAPWSIVLMVAAAVALTIGAVLDLWVVAILAGCIGIAGVGLLVLTALKGGRHDAPR